MSESRSRILMTMANLLEKQGYHATGLNEIIRESGSPKGSLYYYFPGGKEQIGVEAIRASGETIANRLGGLLGDDLKPAEAIFVFLMHMADNMDSSDFTGGSPLTTVAIETADTNAAINKACQQAFDQISGRFKDKFMQAGFGEAESSELALLVTTVIEGGILLSRAYHSTDLFRKNAKHLKAYLESL